MSRVVTKEKAIRRAQHLDLIYSQADMLYNIIPHALWSLNENLRLAPGPHVDGVVGSTSSTTATQLVGKFSQMNLSSNPTNVNFVTILTTMLDQSFVVNSSQATTSQTS